MNARIERYVAMLGVLTAIGAFIHSIVSQAATVNRAEIKAQAAAQVVIAFHKEQIDKNADAIDKATGERHENTACVREINATVESILTGIEDIKTELRLQRREREVANDALRRPAARSDPSN